MSNVFIVFFVIGFGLTVGGFAAGIPAMMLYKKLVNRKTPYAQYVPQSRPQNQFI